MIIALLVLMSFCGNSFGSTTMNMESRLTCEEALILFTNKEFEQWHGLPSECQISDIFSLFKSITEDASVGKLGSEYIPSFYKVYVLENYNEPIQVWFKDNAILKIEAKYPQLSANQYQAITKALGEPTDKLDYYFDILMIPNGEWVYPKRGISLFLNADGTGLVNLSVYHPTSLETYKRNIRKPFYPPREFPVKELDNE